MAFQASHGGDCDTSLYLYVQGIETVRRDNCLLVRNVISTCLDKILIEKDVAGAKAYVCSTISDLLMNRMDLSLLVITKVIWSTLTSLVILLQT